MKVITDKEYVRDYINSRLESILNKLNKDEDVSIEEKYIGTKVVKELSEAELTDDEIVNIYNVCDYNKFVNLIEALESADVLNCGNTNEMIKKLTIIIWCHYENIDANSEDVFNGDTILVSIPDIAKKLKEKEDDEDIDIDDYDTDSDNCGIYDSRFDDFLDDPFGGVVSNPFGSDDIFGNNDTNKSVDIFRNNNKENEESLDELATKVINKLHNEKISEAYNKFKEGLDIIKDIMENGD